MKKRIIPIFVPHRGCPHDCIFCNQKKITGVSTDMTSEDVRNIVDEYLTTIDKDASVEIAFFGGSFTAIDIDIQNVYGATVTAMQGLDLTRLMGLIIK